ncbi:MAG: macrophage mannose receptor 1-like [Deltaproteobacteria bacterium]|nr:macrophage mannose receptor 1-like [Deltaproteobacteria bacterium]
MRSSRGGSVILVLALGGGLGVGLGFGAGCLRQTEFRCDTNADCGAAGQCEAIGFCSVADSSCAGSMQRFGDSAGGGLANSCVPGGGGGPDASVEIDAPMALVDASDVPVGNCPSGYLQLTGGAAGHRYKLLPAGNWDASQAACLATAPAAAYLAIPDDAAELQAFATFNGAGNFWVGISDAAVENIFVNVKNLPQIFLPWAPGEPDDTQGGQDCVAGISATEIETDKCNTAFPAVCECEE